MADIDREIGSLNARVDGLERWMKALTEQMAQQTQALQAIEKDLATAKGAGRVVIGLSMVMGGFMTFIGERVMSKWL